MAGSSGIDPLARQEGVTNKAFILLSGRPLLAYVLESLARAPSIRRVIAVGPPVELEALREGGLPLIVVPETGSMLDNAAAGLEQAAPDGLCLLSTGDIPLLTAGTVEHFLALCRPREADFFYPVLSRESYRSFPETQRTYVRLRDGALTGGNLVLIRPSWFRDYRGQLEIFIATRKNPLKLWRFLPPLILFKFLCGRLAVIDLEDAFSKALHLRARAVPCDLVELGLDVDKPGDLQIVRQELARREGRNQKGSV